MASVFNNFHDKVAIVVTTYAKSEFFERCLRSLPSVYTLITADHEGLFLSEKRNRGASMTQRKYVLFCDDDNELDYGAVDSLFQEMERDPTIAIAGMLGVYKTAPNVVCDGGSFRSMISGLTYDRNVNKFRYEVDKFPYQVDEVANVFMVRKDVFTVFCGFDTIRFPIDLDEADLCRRVKKAGWKVVIVPNAITRHDSNTYSRMPDFRRPLNAYFMGRNKILFQKKHLNLIGLIIYLSVFLPMTIIGYLISLTIHKNTKMIPHFLRGVWHGIRNRLDYSERYRC